MGGIGHKTGALLLGFLQPVGQVIEFPPQQRQLIIPADADLVTVVPALDDAHGVHDISHPQPETGGIDQGEKYHKYPQ